MHAITALTEELLGPAEISATSQQEQLNQIRTMGTRATNLVRDFLDYSLLKRGDMPLNLAPVSLPTVAENVISVLKLAGKDMQKPIEVMLPPDLPLMYADEARLYQVLYILMEKGVQHAQDSVELTAAVDGGFISVKVAGSGEPFPAATAMLYNYPGGSDGNNVQSSEAPLLLIRQLVALHGGTIHVEVADKVAFTFTLPIAPDDALQSREELTAQHLWNEGSDINSISGPGPHILIIDDSPYDLGATASVLGAKGFTVTAVRTGKEAMDKIRDSTISLVVLDLLFPGQTAYDICREIRRIRSAQELPILVLTAKTAIQDIDLAFEAGANDFLAKPFEKEELLARVQILVDLKQSVDKAIASEFAYLQAQIKPHFLFNSLSVIAALIISEPLKARDLIVDFSDYLRHSFSSSSTEEMVPLAKEIELIQAYVALERARMGSRLDFQLVADDYSGVEVPRLILQPLVENAIRHGIYSLPAGGSVLLRIVRGREELHLSVCDDGVGMALNPGDSMLPVREKPGVGLANIHKRLLGHYGKGLSITSSPGQGTTVTFSVPLSSTREEEEV